MRTIVKVQTPLFPKDGQALVYNRSRSVMVNCPVDASLKKLMEGKAKAFFEADVVKNEIRFIKSLPDQDW